MAKKKEGNAADGIANNTAVSSGPRNAVPVVYCGPSLPGSKMISMAVYRGGLPPHVTALMEKIPEIGRLIVPVDKLNDTRTKAATPGTEENRLHQMILESGRSI
jgi:hypothetical protein